MSSFSTALPGMDVAEVTFPGGLLGHQLAEARRDEPKETTCAPDHKTSQ
jgi:hypothetical protein